MAMDSNTKPAGEQPRGLERIIPIQAEATKPILEVSDKIAISVGLITAIILFFEEKTPVVVVVLLTIGFACGLYVLRHLVRILPWVAKANGSASWPFLSTIIVAGIILAKGVEWYWVEKSAQREITAG